MTPRFHEFLRFCIVGGIAFVVDAALLLAFVALGMPDAVGRILSITLAMQLAYVLNSRFTFRDHRGIGRATWLAYMASNTLGAGINYLVFLATLALAPIGDAHLLRLAAIAAGTAVALVFNYWANRRYTFRARQP